MIGVAICNNIQLVNGIGREYSNHKVPSTAITLPSRKKKRNVVDVVYVKSVCFRFIFTCDADTELFHDNNLQFPCGKRAVSFCRHGAT